MEQPFFFLGETSTFPSKGGNIGSSGSSNSNCNLHDKNPRDSLWTFLASCYRQHVSKHEQAALLPSSCFFPLTAVPPNLHLFSGTKSSVNHQRPTWLNILQFWSRQNLYHLELPMDGLCGSKIAKYPVVSVHLLWSTRYEQKNATCNLCFFLTLPNI